MNKEKESRTEGLITGFLKGKGFTLKEKIVAFVLDATKSTGDSIYAESVGRLLRSMSEVGMFGALETCLIDGLAHYKLKGTKTVEDKTQTMKLIYEAYKGLYDKQSKHSINEIEALKVMQKILNIKDEPVLETPTGTRLVMVQGKSVKEVSMDYKLLQGERFI